MRQCPADCNTRSCPKSPQSASHCLAGGRRGDVLAQSSKSADLNRLGSGQRDCRSQATARRAGPSQRAGAGRSQIGTAQTHRTLNGPPTASRRYSRLETCATKASVAVPSHIKAPRSGALMVAVGFNPRFRCSPTTRVAERRSNTSLTDFRRRSATRYQLGLAAHRGLKPTATLKPSLRDGPSQHARQSIGCSRRGERADGQPSPTGPPPYGGGYRCGPCSRRRQSAQKPILGPLLRDGPANTGECDSLPSVRKAPQGRGNGR
jgi:hypothetical protein